jgi:hypothetical protein
MSYAILGFNGAGFVPVSEKIQGNKKSISYACCVLFSPRPRTNHFMLFDSKSCKESNSYSTYECNNVLGTMFVGRLLALGLKKDFVTN